MSMTEVVRKRFVRGTHRSVPPEDTFNRMKALMPAFGVTRVADVTGLDSIGIPVAMAYRPNSRSVAVSPGKGLDLFAAKASALMEAIEGWHAERILQPLLFGSYNELRFERRVVEISGLPRRAAGELNEDTRLLWIEGLELLGGEPIWVPFEMVHTNYALPMPTSSGALVASSNGLASGNHKLEAVSHAICEIVERDATTLWHALGDEARQRTAVDLASVDDAACVAILERFEHAGVSVGIWETTSDVGIPAFRCVIAEACPGGLRSHLPGVGAGCHPVRAIALSRALTEAAQTRLTLISGARDDIGMAKYLRSADASAHERTLKLIGGTHVRRPFGQAPSYESETFNEDLGWQLERLTRVGISQVVVVELTKPRLGIPVCRVLIPGLEGIHEAPGYVAGARYRRTLKEQKN